MAIKILVNHIKSNSGWESQYEGVIPSVGKKELEHMLAVSLTVWLKDNGIVARVKVER
jgi:hypothetical protein